MLLTLHGDHRRSGYVCTGDGAGLGRGVVPCTGSDGTDRRACECGYAPGLRCQQSAGDCTARTNPLATTTRPHASSAEVRVGVPPNEITTGAVSAEVSHNKDGERAQAVVKDASVTALITNLAARSVTATCSAQRGASTLGTTTLSGATVGTTELPVSPAPNTKIRYPEQAPTLELTLNEQSIVDGALTVNAMHAHALDGTGDLIIGSATCGPLEPADEPLCTDGQRACGDGICIDGSLFCNGERTAPTARTKQTATHAD